MPDFLKFSLQRQKIAEIHTVESNSRSNLRRIHGSIVFTELHLRLF